MINTILNIPLFSPITTVDYVSWLFFICFFYAIVGLFFLRSKFRHQENRKKLMYILVFGGCVLIGASLVSAYCANSSFKIGIYTLPFYNPQIEIVSPAETKQYFNIFILKNEMV